MLKHKFLSLFVTLIATTALWAGNTITYTATEKLTETADSHSRGLHTNAFNVSISSHTFSSGTGTITFAGDVTSIGNYAFKMCSVLTSVTIPNSVATIGGEAFYDCDGLTSVMIGNSVTTIGYYAFYDCNVLSSITIPNSVTKIEYDAFAYCSSLTSITIPSSVTEIGSNAFIGCSGLTSVTLNSNAICSKTYKNSSNIGTIFGSQVKEYIIGDSVTSIGNYSFWKCGGLTSATIGNSVTTIGECAFCQCGDLTIAAIPNSVMTIGDNAFQSCSSLTRATIGNSVTTIGKYAFSECRSLTSMTIPNSVTKIEEGAFSVCTSLTSVIIGNSVTMIGYGAFSNCDSLISVTCRATTPPTCGGYCFDNVDKAIPVYVPYNSIPAYKAANGWKAFTNILPVECLENTPKHHIDSITTCYGELWHNEYYSRSGDYYDTIPNQFGCDSIIYQLNLVVYPSYYSEDTIQINQGDTIFHNKGTRWQYYEIPTQTGWSLHADTFQNIYGCDSTIRHYYVIIHETELTCPEYSVCGICGDSLTWVLDTISGELYIKGTGAMYDYYDSDLPWKNYLDNIKVVTIPQGLTYMYNYAFMYCPNLETVYWNVKRYETEYMNDNNKWSGCRNFIFGDSVKSVPGLLCYACHNLQTIVLPNSVIAIGNSAFANCDSLTSVTCEATTPPTCSYGCFYSVYKSIPLYVPAQSVAAYKAADGWKDFTNIQGICERTPSFSQQDTTICGHPYSFVWEGDSVHYGGEVEHWTSTKYGFREVWSWRDRTDTITRNYISIGGCDSLLQLVVHYPHYQYSIIKDTIEDGQAYWGKYTKTGIYYDRSLNTQGCDSNVYEIHLYVTPKPTYTVTLSVNNAKYGSVEGKGTYNKGDTVILMAIPNKGYQFNQWSDGNTDNPRTIYRIDKDYTLTAQFGMKQCSWLVESSDLEMGAVYTDFTNEYYNYGTQITVEASANSGYKFVKWNDGKKHNPYKFSILEDKYLLALFIAEEEEADTTQVQPSDTTATFTWPFIVGGFTYTLTIYLDAACTIPFCTLTFNQYGQLIGITFGARAPRRSAMANQEEGFTTTINGLSAGTEYFYKMETKDEDGKLLNTDEGGFITKSDGVITNTDKVEMSIHGSKFIKDNRLYIFRGDKIYNAVGGLMK